MVITDTMPQPQSSRGPEVSSAPTRSRDVDQLTEASWISQNDGSSSSGKRKRSSSADKQEDSRFQQVKVKVQELFPDLVPTPEAQAKYFASMAEKEFSEDSPRQPRVVLPWSKGIQDTRTKLQDTVVPTDSASTLRIGKFVSGFASSMQHYRIYDAPSSHLPVKVNDDFSSLTSGGKLGSVQATFSDADMSHAEGFARRVQMVTSTMDWFCSSVGRQLKDLLPEDPNLEDSVVVPAKALMEIRDALGSVSKAVSQLAKDSGAELVNSVLRRRDAHLKKASSRLSEAVKLRLRSANVFSSTLFDPEVVKAAIAAVKSETDLMNAVSLGNTLQKIAAPTKQKPSSSSQPKKNTSSFKSQPKPSKSRDNKGGSSKYKFSKKDSRTPKESKGSEKRS